MKGLPTWSEFTRANYRRLVAIAKANYRLAPVSEYLTGGRLALWRHDVDCSPQAAVALGTIEADLGVRATYYFNLRSEFYNVFEGPVAAIVRMVASMGHEIGLHFDAACSDISTIEALNRALHAERSALETLIGVKIESFSFHNPGEATAIYKDRSYNGMINAYSADIQARFEYCSDSNGYWRFDPLEAALTAGHSAICVLTHPEWWQDQAMSPRDRIVRCVEGRAAAVLRRYDDLLERRGRKNIR